MGSQVHSVRRFIQLPPSCQIYSVVGYKRNPLAGTCSLRIGRVIGSARAALAYVDDYRMGVQFTISFKLAIPFSMTTLCFKIMHILRCHLQRHLLI